MEEDVMKVAVYDNKGKTFDRYTVIIGNDVFGMSDNPNHPQGFNQFCGELCASGITESNILRMSEETFVENLPRQVIKAIVERIKDY